MTAKTDNICQILGLNPYEESKYTLDVINGKIDKIETKWKNESRNKQNDSGQRFKYNRLLETVDDMRRRMADPVLRRKEFFDGQKELQGKCQKLKMSCVITTDGKFIVLPGQLDGFVKRLHWDGVDKNLVKKLANISDENVHMPVSKNVSITFTNLEAVDCSTPAEMLNRLINNEMLEIRCDKLSDSSSLSQVRNAFDLCEKRVNNVRQEVLPDQDSYINALRSLKLIIDSDKEMVDLINYGKCYKALKPAMDLIEEEYTGVQIQRKYIDDIMTIYARGYDLNMCMPILEEFCHKKKMAANFSQNDSSMIRCPECNSMVTGGSNTIFCPYCGKNFKTSCPKCGTAQQTGNTVCIKCGFNFKDAETKAQTIALNFRMDIQKGMIIKAERDLAQLKNAYSGYSGYTTMEMQLQQAKSKLANLKKLFNDSISHGKYYTARDIGDQIISQYPETFGNDPEMKHRYNDAVDRVQNAEIYCNKAAEASTKDEALNLYVSAQSVCPDYPEARNFLREHPPQGPVDASGSITEGCLVLRFEPPVNNKGVTFMIYREKNSLPDVSEETRPLAEIPSCEFRDKAMEPGVEYYYSVYSKRWGILSKEAAHFGPVITLNEVEAITIDQIDGGLRIMYEKPRGAARVRIWRADESDKGSSNVEIPVKDETVYDDIGLKGGVTYHYLFVAEYESHNKIERSNGTFRKATPVDAPEPVRDMAIKWNKTDGTYTAKWTTKNKVLLFHTDKKYAFPGKMVKMDDVRSWMKEIDPIREYDDGMDFSLPDGSIQYIYPIIPMGTVGIKGNESMVANLKPFRDVEKSISNKNCILTMNWPEDAVAAKLVISDNESKDLDDLTAEIMIVTREEYNEDRLIRIPMGKAPKKCINIFASYKEGKETLYSRGITIDVYSAECKKVRYTMKADRRNATIDFSTDPEVTQLPEVVAVRVAEGIPLRKEDGAQVGTSNGPVKLNNGTGRLVMDLGGATDVEHIRLFFADEENYNLFRFIHPLYNRRA